MSEGRSSTTIVRAKHDGENPYYIASRETARNVQLSYEARGLLADLLSRPDDWKIRVATLIRPDCKRDKLNRILEELVNAGHLEKPVRIQREKGQWGWTPWLLHELPPKTGQPTFGGPVTVLNNQEHEKSEEQKTPPMPPAKSAGGGEEQEPSTPAPEKPAKPAPASYLATIPLSPSVVHFKDVSHLWSLATQKWLDERYVYIGRANAAYRLPASKWSNPFIIDEQHSREQVIKQYHKRLLASPDLMAALPELDGKILVGFDRPDTCHGDVLVHVLTNPDAPQPKPDNPWYEAIKTIWGYTAGMNKLMQQMLQGKASLRGWKEYNLEPPMADPAELREWAKWWFDYEHHSDGTHERLLVPKELHIYEQRLKIQSSIGEYRDWKRGQQPALAPAEAIDQPLAAQDFMVVDAKGRVLGMYQELCKQAPAGVDPLDYIDGLKNGGTP